MKQDIDYHKDLGKKLVPHSPSQWSMVPFFDLVATPSSNITKNNQNP
jgi:hypothetical protein